MTIHIITGPPCGGKTTHIQTHAQPGDIRIDLDAIANLLANTQGHEHTSDTLKVARAARTAAINKALEVTGVDVWIIHTQLNQSDLQRYAQHNANIITIDPGKDEVMHRCKTQRPRASLIVAAKWYDQQTQTNAASNHVTITTGKAKRTKRSTINFDASTLPNPHDNPALRPLDGTSRKVQDWLLQHDEFSDALDDLTEHALLVESITITCSAGKHRSVAMAELLAQRLQFADRAATINHTVLGKQERPNSHLRGYTHYEHKKPRQLLLRKHKDGAECFWCGLPMFKKPERNWDERPLAADHSQPGGAARGMKPDRLLHGYCNSQAGDHSRDDERPVVVGCHPRDWLKPVSKKKRVEVNKLFKW